MAHSAPSNPRREQVVRRCIDGVWHEKRQELWYCVSSDHDCGWCEWRDSGTWYSTGLRAGKLDESPRVSRR